MEYNDIDELREIAKEAGIQRVHLKKEETLLKELADLEDVDVEVPEKTPKIAEMVVTRKIEVELEETNNLESSAQMQSEGWEVYEIKSGTRGTVHYLRRPVSQT